MDEFTPPTPPRSQRTLTRRAFVTTGAAGLGLALYAGEIGRHELEVTYRTIALRDLPTPFHGLRIAQLSDIHFDSYTEPFFVKRVVERVNALQPDVVLLTGDFVSYSPAIRPIRQANDHCAELLSALQAPQRFAILGNHDHQCGIADEITAAIKASGATVLRNQHVPLERGGERIWLAGTDDAGTGFANLDLTLPNDPKAPVLLMVHEPDYADQVLAHPRSHTVSLMLAGHTHGGQVRLPFLPPLSLPPLGRKYVEGHFQIGEMQLYVNRGIGAVGLPFRLNCPPEITMLTLESA